MIIVGLGEILWDVFPDKKVLGGAPANFAYHISQFGYDGYAVSAIGHDQLGKDIILNLEQNGLAYVIEETPFPTGTVQISLNESGIPTYEIRENVAWDNIPFSNETESLARRTHAVCFGSMAQRSEVSRNTIRKFTATMPADSLKIFDINFRLNFYTKEIVHESLLIANIMKINDEEVIEIAKLFDWTGTEQEICRKILNDYHLKILILTKGTEGSYIFTTEACSFLPTPKVKIADTVGAGDSFTAAFLSKYLVGESIEVAHQFAVDISAYVCTQHGAMPKLPKEFTETFKK